MHLENTPRLDFKDVLIRPKRSTLTSRSEVDITREFKFLHSSKIYRGIPIIAANMDTTGTFEMSRALERHQLWTALHKHYEKEAYTPKPSSTSLRKSAKRIPTSSSWQATSSRAT